MKRSETSPRTVKVRFRHAEFDRLAESFGLSGLRAKASFIGCSPNTLWRMSNGRSAPSAEFIARVAKALPHIPITRLFDFGSDRHVDRAA